MCCHNLHNFGTANVKTRTLGLSEPQNTAAVQKDIEEPEEHDKGIIMEVAQWCDHELSWRTESRLAFTVVNRWGELEATHKQEIFSLPVHLSWRIKMEVQENATAQWCPKSGTAHPYEWEVRVRVYLHVGTRDVVMGHEQMSRGSWEHRKCYPV